MKKPAPVIVFGVINCLVGGVTLLMVPVWLLAWHASFTRPPNPMISPDQTYQIALAANSAVQLTLPFWLVASGIGLLQGKRSARRILLAFVALAILTQLVAVPLKWVMTVVPMQEHADLRDPGAPWQLIRAFSGNLAVLGSSLVYSGFAFRYLFWRRPVREYFAHLRASQSSARSS
ncbi:hypothetical protein ACFL5O_10290 [Myxococcota bacterium]